jgi:hypothetical protein
MCTAMTGEKAHLVFVLQISNLLKLITQPLENMGVPGGGGGGFVWQTKPVGQYSLHSRAILAYYKNKWDKFCPFCGSLGPVKMFVCVSFSTGNLNCFRVK